VLALHGGPAAHWPLAFDAGLQALAEAGLAVVAPNPRGSTGYGRRHEEAIKGAWGGPDLADVIAVGTCLTRVRGGHRPPPALYGASYGAFLALLAMAEAPRLWSGCVAIAPFQSTTRLYADAGPGVRALLDRLDGLATAGGPRPVDLLRRASQLRGRILVLHGGRDPTVPVRHSRELVAALAGVPGVAVTYHELAGGGHQPVRPGRHCPHFAEIVRFLGGTVPAEPPDQDWR
jgi:dipeptidyl aminopeptidase/acylaminoacyl peptidase